MYVRLKHTLSSLALEMLPRAPRRRSVAWLLAYARMAPHGEPVSLDRLQVEAAKLGPAGPRALARLEALGILERSKGTIRLAAQYIAHADYFIQHVERLARALQVLDDAPPAAATPLARGVLLFNSGLFFECHEYLEDVWRRTTGPDRNFYHAIIQAAAAFYHFEKNNLHGARTLLAKSLEKLEGYRPACRGVDVDHVIIDLQQWHRRFAADQPGRPLRAQEFPQIHGRGLRFASR